VPNRGRNSIAGFSVDAVGGLTGVGRGAAEAVPGALGRDRGGGVVYAAGSAAGGRASERGVGVAGGLRRLGG
jgi:hypothetical protein